MVPGSGNGLHGSLQVSGKHRRVRLFRLDVEVSLPRGQQDAPVEQVRAVDSQHDMLHARLSMCGSLQGKTAHMGGGFTEENPELLQRCWDEIEVHCGTRNLSFLRFNGAGPLAEGRGMMHVLRELEAKGFYTEEYWEERGS